MRALAIGRCSSRRNLARVVELLAASDARDADRRAQRREHRAELGALHAEVLSRDVVFPGLSRP